MMSAAIPVPVAEAELLELPHGGKVGERLVDGAQRDAGLRRHPLRGRGEVALVVQGQEGVDDRLPRTPGPLVAPVDACPCLKHAQRVQFVLCVPQGRFTGGGPPHARRTGPWCRPRSWR